jgi:GxxExxY protein
MGSAIEVHKQPGPGLLENAYEVYLVCELKQKGLKPEQQGPLPVVYKDVKPDSVYQLDLLVGDKVIIE